MTWRSQVTCRDQVTCSSQLTCRGQVTCRSQVTCRGQVTLSSVLVFVAGAQMRSMEVEGNFKLWGGRETKQRGFAVLLVCYTNPIPLPDCKTFASYAL